MVNRITVEEGQTLKLDLACGDNKQEGYFGIDCVSTASTDYVWDLTVTPWPIDDETVDEIVCNHFLEHLTGRQRIAFMEECYRILKPEAKLIVVTPYWSSMRAVQDPTHQWPPVCEASYLYFNREWREKNKLQHYGINCDFDYTYGYALDSDLLPRNLEWQQFAVKHYIQSVNDLQATLIKRATKQN